jgi:DtxR family Mn-dependent transcriptional regulator
MSDSVEEYLEAIYAFNEKGRMAKNQDLAQRLKVAPASITQMIKKLADDGLVAYDPYKGVMLTGKGSAQARKVVRKHRLLERFLHDNLGVSNTKVHNEACRLEHSLSEEVESAICQSLNNPSTCPDDSNPIPSCTIDHVSCDQCKELREDKKASRLLTQLSQLRPGDESSVAFIRNGRNVAQRIIDMGLCPGTRIKVVNAAPFHGPIEIEVRDTRLAIGHGLAEKIYVEVENGLESTPHPRGPHHVVGSGGDS